MNQIILNEKEYAEKCLEEKPRGLPNFQTLSILARYFFHTKGYNKKLIYNELLNYINSTCVVSGFYRARLEETLEKLAANAKKYKLHEINGVSVTKAELKIIDAIDNKVLRRLAFTMLCLAKLGDARNPNNNGWVRLDAKDIFKLARISCGVDERNEKISQLYQRGLLEFAKRNDNMDCRVTYITNDSDGVLFISDFRELGYEYLKYCGENFIRCMECEVLTRGNKNGTKKYCTHCAVPLPADTKIVECIDCGNRFEISTKNNKTNRCPHCNMIYRRKRKNIEQQQRRASLHLKS